MQRKFHTDPEIESLQDQCLDIRVQLSLMMEQHSREPTTIAALLDELAALESRIRDRRPIQ